MRNKLTKNADGSYTLVTREHLTYQFAQVGDEPEFRLLTKVSDLSGNFFTLNYGLKNGEWKVDDLTDTRGELIDFRYDVASGRLTGIEYAIHDVLAVGARAQTLARLFNLREGITAADDKLPKRVMTAFTEGPLEGIEITDEAFAWARRRYYELMKWDPESGEPLPECLRELGLEELLPQAGE